MATVTVNAPRVYSVFGTHLMPGKNEVSDDLVKRMQSHKLIMLDAEAGVLSFEEPKKRGRPAKQEESTPEPEAE